MNPKVKNYLKVFGISFGAVLGACGLVMLGLFLFGAFKAPYVEPTSMHFVVDGVYHETTTNEYKKDTYLIDEDCYIKLQSMPEDATELELVININNGNDIITLPESYRINRPILLSVEQETLTVNNNTYDVNKGGVVELYARTENGLVDCYCTIFVDVVVEEYSIKLVDENENRLFLSEDSKSLIKYEQNANGEYGYDAENKVYKLKQELANYQGAYYNKVESKIYPGTEFYVMIDEVYPSDALAMYDNILLTSVHKTFKVFSSDETIATVEMENVNTNPRAKISILVAEQFTISSSLINSYKNIALKAELDEKVANGEFPDDDALLSGYTNVVNEFTKKSNEFTFEVNTLTVQGMELDVKNLALNKYQTVEINSLEYNEETNKNGIGLELISPSNSQYSNEQLEYRLSDVQVRAGYKAQSEEINSNKQCFYR